MRPTVRNPESRCARGADRGEGRGETRNFGGRVWESRYHLDVHRAFLPGGAALGPLQRQSLPRWPVSWEVAGEAKPGEGWGGAEHQVRLQGCSTQGTRLAPGVPCIAQNASCPSESLAVACKGGKGKGPMKGMLMKGGSRKKYPWALGKCFLSGETKVHVW